MIRYNFAIFILTHGRANNIKTINTLKKCGYTGKIYFVVDDEDKQKEEYIKKFGDRTVIFSKSEIEKKIDTCDNFGDRRTILHARNACFDIAESLGLEYFLELDDDYTVFEYKRFLGAEKVKAIRNFDEVINKILDFFSKSNLSSIALSQGGDHIGGENGKLLTEFKRKAMNSFFCSVNRRFYFRGTFNEDVNTYTSLGKIGHLFFTIPQVSLTQTQTQSNKGGITELYLKFGTYVKSFFTVMQNPSSVKIAMMQTEHARIHHKIEWKYQAPAIIREKYRK